MHYPVQRIKGYRVLFSAPVWAKAPFCTKGTANPGSPWRGRLPVRRTYFSAFRPPLESPGTGPEDPRGSINSPLFNKFTEQLAFAVGQRLVIQSGLSLNRTVAVRQRPPSL